VRSQISGFTLLELMVTILVMVILLGIGVPSYIQFKEDQTLLGAAQTLYGDIQLARSETIKRRSNDMFILFVSNDGQWCYRISDNTANCVNSCSDTCDIQNDGMTRGADSSRFQGVTLDNISYASGKLNFNSRRGITNEGDVDLRYGASKTLRVHTSALGRATICAPSGSTYSGVQSCN